MALEGTSNARSLLESLVGLSSPALCPTSDILNVRTSYSLVADCTLAVMLCSMIWTPSALVPAKQRYRQSLSLDKNDGDLRMLLEDGGSIAPIASRARKRPLLGLS